MFLDFLSCCCFKSVQNLPFYTTFLKIVFRHAQKKGSPLHFAEKLVTAPTLCQTCALSLTPLPHPPCFDLWTPIPIDCTISFAIFLQTGYRTHSLSNNFQLQITFKHFRIGQLLLLPQFKIPYRSKHTYDIVSLTT
jgi:hypothetical protein